MLRFEKLLLGSIASAVWLGGFHSAVADTVTINPSDDGTLNTCEGCNTVDRSASVLVSGKYIQGIVRFPMAGIAGSISQAVLTVNPYGLPLFDLNVGVYGISAGGAIISADDANAGTFLGTMHLSPDLGYGQDATFDVTPFLTGVSGFFVGFNLRNTGGTDVFSSIEINHGHPAQLQVSTVPEPTCVALLGLAIGAGALWRFAKPAGGGGRCALRSAANPTH